MPQSTKFRGFSIAAATLAACILSTSVNAEQVSRPAQSEQDVVLFFNADSAALTPEAKLVVWTAVDTAWRTNANRIELAVHAASAESAHDPELLARRAAAVEEQITGYGYEGDVVVVDQPAPKLVFVIPDDNPFDRRAVLRIGN